MKFSIFSTEKKNLSILHGQVFVNTSTTKEVQDLFGRGIYADDTSLPVDHHLISRDERRLINCFRSSFKGQGQFCGCCLLLVFWK